MTDWQVIADRDNGDDPQWEDIREGDRWTLERHHDIPLYDRLVRIERPAPNIVDMAPGATFTAKIERAAELLRQRVQDATPGEFAYHDWPTSNESEVTVDGRPIAYPDEDLVIFGTPDAALIVLAVTLLKSGAIEALLNRTDPGNPFIYDPWDDDSVDPGNLDEVVHAAVDRGWSAGAYAVVGYLADAILGSDA